MTAKGVKAGDAFVEVSLRSKISATAKRVQKDLRAVSTSLKSTGAGLQSAGASVAAPLIAGLVGVGTIFGTFSHKMSEVRAITGAAGENFDRLNAKAKELGSSTSFSASQAAEAMKFLGMAGYDTEQILAGVGPTLQLAAAGGLELAEAADIASDVSSAFGLTAEDIGRVADVLASTATSANTDVTMMGEAFKYAAPLAAAAGQSIEETSAALGVLANSGLKATVAGNDIAGILKNLVKNSGDLKDLGVEIADAEGNFRSITEVMQDFGAATTNLTQVERLEKSEEIFGRYAKSAIVLSNSIPEIKDLKAKLDASAGSAGKMAAIMQDDLWGSFKSLTSAAEGLIIAIGGGADGMFRSIMDTVSSGLRAVASFLNANQEIATVIAAVAIAAATAGAAVFVLGTGLVFAGAVASAVSAIIGSVGLVVAAVAAGVVISIAQWAALGGAFLYVLHQAGLLMPILDFVKSKLYEMAATFKVAFGGIKDALAAGQYMLAARILMQSLKVIFMQGLNALYQAFVGLWKNSGSITWKFLKSLGKMLYRVFSSIPDILWSALSGGAKITEILGRALTGGLDGNGNLFDVDSAKADLDKLSKRAAHIRKRQAAIAKQQKPAPRQQRQAAPRQQRQRKIAARDHQDRRHMQQRGVPPQELRDVQRLQAMRRQMAIDAERRRRAAQQASTARQPRQDRQDPRLPQRPNFAAIARQSQQRLAATRSGVGRNGVNQAKHTAFTTTALEKIATQQLSALRHIAGRPPVVIQEARI